MFKNTQSVQYCPCKYIFKYIKAINKSNKQLIYRTINRSIDYSVKIMPTVRKRNASSTLYSEQQKLNNTAATSQQICFTLGCLSSPDGACYRKYPCVTSVVIALKPRFGGRNLLTICSMKAEYGISLFIFYFLFKLWFVELTLVRWVNIGSMS